MDISNELLASYSEGKVTESERCAVRDYLAEHPDEMETVMMMMDDDFDLQLDDDPDIEPLPSNNSSGAFADISYSSAAFAPRTIHMKISKSLNLIDKGGFQHRLSNLLDELDI